MRFFNEIDGDLIKLTKERKFDVIAHGCNCFCTQKSGLAPQMVKAFGTDTFKLEAIDFKGDINKLGQVDHEVRMISESGKIWTLPENNTKFSYDKTVIVCNFYTQYYYGMDNGIPFDYEALKLCLRKVNKKFATCHIGLPEIGCGLAGAEFSIVKNIIQRELKDMDVTIVHFKK